jgi:hypothetical protein
MHPAYSNYDALMRVHRARIESARASAVAAGLSNRPRRGHRTIDTLVQRHRRRTIRPGHNPETLFFA